MTLQEAMEIVSRVTADPSTPGKCLITTAKQAELASAMVEAYERGLEDGGA